MLGASLPNIVLREAEVIAHDAHAVPPAGAHNGRDIVAANEEVLRRAHAQGVPRDFALAGPLATGLDDREFHDVADTPPAEGPVEDFTPPDGAENEPAAFRQALQPGTQVFRAPPGSVDEPPAAELVALAAPDDGAQPAALGKFNVAHLQRGEFRSSGEEVIAQREEGAVARPGESARLRSRVGC